MSWLNVGAAVAMAFALSSMVERMKAMREFIVLTEECVVAAPLEFEAGEVVDALLIFLSAIGDEFFRALSFGPAIEGFAFGVEVKKWDGVAAGGGDAIEFDVNDGTSAWVGWKF